MPAKRRNIGLLLWRGQAQCLGEASRCRDDKLGRMDEREQLEQVESGQIGIAEPLPQQRSVEQDMRRFCHPANRLPLANRAGFAIDRANPDATMARVECGIGEWCDHLAADDRYAGDPRVNEHQNRI